MRKTLISLLCLQLTFPCPVWAEPESTSAVKTSEEAAEEESSADDGTETKTVEKSASASSTELESTVTAKKPFTAASSSTIRDRDFKLRPIRRPSDIIQLAPGIFVVQHAGGGKAMQYFLRGFDSDHGTDIAIFVDGVPVNMVSHAHGQGFSDLNWLIPETVDRIEVMKGTYFTQLGDFATGGGLNIITKKRAPSNQVTVQAGNYGNARLLALSTGNYGGVDTLIAAEGFYNDGAYISPERFRRYNVFAKGTMELSSRATLGVTATAYGGFWNASGQIPSRAVIAGTLDRFGSIDRSEGGDSNREGAVGTFAYRTGGASKFSMMAYLNRYRLDLYSNFTFFLDNPGGGDQINQKDSRTMAGGELKYEFTEKIVDDVPLTTTLGLQTRNDSIVNSLSNTSSRTLLLSQKYKNDVRVTSVGGFGNADAQLTSWLRAVAGARVDFQEYNVKDFVTQANFGTRNAWIFSPKASLVIHPFEKTDIYLNAGAGFHSNDARGIVVGDPKAPGTNLANPLNKVYGYEIGSRTKFIDDRLDLAGSLFLIDQDNETVWVGDSGGTETKGASRRMGVELEARFKLIDWVYFDTDFTLSKGVLRDLPRGRDNVPYAPKFITQGGISVQHPDGYYGRFGYFHISDRDAAEDASFKTEGFWRFDFSGGYRTRSYDFNLAVLNIFNTKWREAQFLTTSRLPAELAPANCGPGSAAVDDGAGGFVGCQDVHFSPGYPLSVQASASVFF